MRATAGLLGALAIVVVAATAPSTSADWEDRGRTLVPVLAGDPAPDPTVVAPITDGANTVLEDEANPENWAWTSRDTATGGRFPYPGPKDFCVDLVVNTETAELSAWELELHLAEPPWDWRPPFTQSMLNSIFYDDNFSVTPAADYATSGLAYMRPDGDGGEYASLIQSYGVSFCAETGSPAYLPPGPGTTYEITSVAVADSGGQAKITLVVKGYTWYFIGYTATFNLEDLLDEALLNGEITQAQYDAWLPTKVWYGPFASGATGVGYNVTVTPYNEYVTFINEHATITLEVTGSQWGVRA
ncbi:hypothetical protein [Agromyces sp. PvR057]|uniref:hypothetical protein n=1 Tax=Agromyces sp. PvR057 TaxID=3156403 RepID=UPI0033956817